MPGAVSPSAWDRRSTAAIHECGQTDYIWLTAIATHAPDGAMNSLASTFHADKLLVDMCLTLHGATDFAPLRYSILDFSAHDTDHGKLCNREYTAPIKLSRSGFQGIGIRVCQVQQATYERCEDQSYFVVQPSSTNKQRSPPIEWFKWAPERLYAGGLVWPSSDEILAHTGAMFRGQARAGAHRVLMWTKLKLLLGCLSSCTSLCSYEAGPGWLL